MEQNFVHCQNVFRIEKPEKANQNVLDAGPIVQPSQAQPSGASLTLFLSRWRDQESEKVVQRFLNSHEVACKLYYKRTKQEVRCHYSFLMFASHQVAKDRASVM